MMNQEQWIAAVILVAGLALNAFGAVNPVLSGFMVGSGVTALVIFDKR